MKKPAPKQLELSVETPTTIKAINVNLKRIAESQERLLAALQRVVSVNSRIAAIRAASSEAGSPGDPTPFNSPLYELVEEADHLSQVCYGISMQAKALMGAEPENWKNV